MENLFAQLQLKFGVAELPHGMLYAFRNGLRFELGGDVSVRLPIRRFAQAHHRASTISRELFKNSSEIYVVVSSYGGLQPKKKRLKSFKHCGLKQSEFTYLTKTPQKDEGHISEFGCDLYRHWDAAQISDRDVIGDILGLGIASKIGIRPATLHAQTYIVDVANGLILHLYDDRAMDIVATQKASLEPIFQTYHDWLLDFDMDRMETNFGKAAG